MKFTTKELSKKTWPDFERLFSQGNGWDSCWCTAYQRGVSGGTTRRGRKVDKLPRNRAEWGEVNRRDKCDLVNKGKAHGILVYANREPVGWCQFGPAGELPLTDEPSSTKLFPDDSAERLWKVTCFVTLKSYHGKGVASIALHGALEAIRKKGGGRIEAYPYALIPEDPPADPRWREPARKPGGKQEIVRNDGPVTYYAGKAFLRNDVTVDGVGPVNAVYWRGIGMFHAGTVAMFEREGFKATGVLPSSPNAKSPWLQASRVVMQKTI